MLYDFLIIGDTRHYRNRPDWGSVRCSFSDRILHSRMPLDPTHVRVKLLQACDQWHSSRVSAFLTVYTINSVQTLQAVHSLPRDEHHHGIGSLLCAGISILFGRGVAERAHDYQDARVNTSSTPFDWLHISVSY
jgi:hypothetical protein